MCTTTKRSSKVYMTAIFRQVLLILTASYEDNGMPAKDILYNMENRGRAGEFSENKSEYGREPNRQDLVFIHGALEFFVKIMDDQHETHKLSGHNVYRVSNTSSRSTSENALFAPRRQPGCLSNVFSGSRWPFFATFSGYNLRDEGRRWQNISPGVKVAVTICYIPYHMLMPTTFFETANF